MKIFENRRLYYEMREIIPTLGPAQTKKYDQVVPEVKITPTKGMKKNKKFKNILKDLMEYVKKCNSIVELASAQTGLTLGSFCRRHRGSK